MYCTTMIPTVLVYTRPCRIYIITSSSILGALWTLRVLLYHRHTPDKPLPTCPAAPLHCIMPDAGVAGYFIVLKDIKSKQHEQCS